MRFGQPEYLDLIWICAILVLFLNWTAKQKYKKRARFCEPEAERKIIPPKAKKVQKIKSFLTVASIAFLVLALTQPRWGFHWEDLKQEGIDIIVAIDVSNSMLAEDIKPNRLERAKRKVKDLIQLLEGDRIGLVAFAGTSFVQCPLTLDYSATEIFLDVIDTDLIPVQGTDLGHAVRTAIGAFETEANHSKSLILITDGEDHGGEIMKAAGEAKQAEVKIFAIGIGQESGAPIPHLGENGGFKTNEEGDVVLSKLDEFTLQQIAVLTGGGYVRSVTGDMDLNTIYLKDIKKKVEKKELKATRRKIWSERFQWFIFFALLCLFTEFTLKERNIQKI